MVLGLAVGPEPRWLAFGGLVLVTGHRAVLVPRHGLVLILGLEVGGCGVSLNRLILSSSGRRHAVDLQILASGAGHLRYMFRMTDSDLRADDCGGWPGSCPLVTA